MPPLQGDEELPGGGAAGVDSYFCPVSRGACAKAFWRLYRMKAARGVPCIVACSGQGLLFIVVGEHQDRSWWLEKLGTSRATMEGEVPVYIDGRTARTIRVERELYTLLCNETLGDASPIKASQ